MKLLLFKASPPPEGGLLADAEKALDAGIEDVTRSIYKHAVILKDEATNTISEAFFPHVRERVLDNSELHGIDVFDISTTYPQFTPLTPAQVQGVLDACAAAEKTHEDYNIAGLFDFIPGLNLLIKQVQDDGKTSPVFCSQYAVDKIASGAGLKLLNAPSADLAPGYLVWSPLVFPAPPLKLLTSNPVNAPTLPAVASFAAEAVKVAEYVAEAVKPTTAQSPTPPTSTN